MHLFFMFIILLSGLVMGALATPAQAIQLGQKTTVVNPTVIEELSLPAADNWAFQLEYSWNHEKEYLASYRQYLYRWREQTIQLQIGKDINHNAKLAAGILQGSVNQYSLLFEDYDFQLKRQGAYLQYQHEFSPALQTQIRFRYETFEQNGSSYYQLDGTEDLLTGHAQVNWHDHNDWIRFHYVRERDTEPIYDLDNNRAALNIKAQNLTGLSWGHALNRHIESVASLYYESYGSDRPNQWNTNLQLIWHVLPQLNMAFGSGYYTEENELITNLTAHWEQRITNWLQLEFEYQLEHASQENSLLHQGELFFSAHLRQQLYWVLQLSGGKETLDDKDYFFSANSTLLWRF